MQTASGRAFHDLKTRGTTRFNPATERKRGSLFFGAFRLCAGKISRGSVAAAAAYRDALSADDAVSLTGCVL